MHTQNKDGRPTSNEPSKSANVDFAEESDYSISASSALGYYDVRTELEVDFAFVNTGTAGNLLVELVDDPSGTQKSIYFSLGLNPFKVKKIWHVASNGFNAFTLVYCATS
jgi:hypothetical protein